MRDLVMCSFIFFLMIRPPPISTSTYSLLPYTTLFRSVDIVGDVEHRRQEGAISINARRAHLLGLVGTRGEFGIESALRADRHDHRILRSEEQTSELQSLMRISYAVLCLKNTKKTT